MPSIKRMAEGFAVDRKFTREEAQAIAAKAQSDGKVSDYEKAQLRNVIKQHKDLFDSAALALLQALVEPPKPPPPPAAGGTVALATSAAYRPVYLSAQGAFSLTPDGAAPRNDVELGDAVFRAAELVDDARGNVFADAKLPAAARTKLLENLQAALAKVAGDKVPAGMDKAQALQLRSSSATVLLHLLEASPEPALRDPALKAYEALIKAEPNVRLRENLTFHLSNSPAAKADPVKTVAEALMKQFAPLTPPYEKWFAGGNKTVNLSWTCGSEFTESFIKTLESKGFKKADGAAAWGPVTLEKTFEKPGVGPTTFRISVTTGGTNLLANTGKQGVHIMGYDGHSNWGKNMTASMRNGPKDPSGGDGQMFVYNLCVGKGVLDKLKETYPNLQSVATFGASYLDTDIDGMCNLLAERADWQKLDAFFNKTDGYWDKNNFVTPIATQVREKVLDRDNDGQADYLDKHFNFNTFDVATDTRRELWPVKQDRPARVLDGTKVNVAAQMLNTVSEFSSILEEVNPDSRVIAAGWFEPTEVDRTVVKFTPDKDANGAPVFKMQISSRYAHMSEEGLRAMVVYEFDKYLASTGRIGDGPVDRKLIGLIGFAQSLDIDESYRDDELWTAFLGRYGFPNIDRNVIQGLLDAEHHHYAGSPEMVEALRAKLPADVLAALARPEVGEPRVNP